MELPTKILYPNEPRIHSIDNLYINFKVFSIDWTVNFMNNGGYAIK